MNLTQRIKEKKSEFQSSAPDEVQEVMGRAKEDKAPDFTLENTRGNYINLNDTLSSGPVVMGFYRGRW